MRSNAGAFRTTATLLVVAVVLNYPWEMAQAFLFASMGSIAQASWRCFLASVGDGVMILGIHAAGCQLFRSRLWFRGASAGRIAFTIAVGALVGVAVEWWGLSIGRWQYEPTMPRVPGLELALVPLLQMPILAPVALRVTDWMLDRMGPAVSGQR